MDCLERWRWSRWRPPPEASAMLDRLASMEIAAQAVDFPSLCYQLLHIGGESREFRAPACWALVKQLDVLSNVRLGILSILHLAYRNGSASAHGGPVRTHDVTPPPTYPLIFEYGDMYRCADTCTTWQFPPDIAPRLHSVSAILLIDHSSNRRGMSKRG